MSEEEKPEVLEEEEEEAEEQETAEATEEPQEDAEEEALEEEAPEEEAEEEEVRYEDAVNNGDFIMVEMTGRAETGEIIETTDEELAREEGVYEEGRSYGPRLVIVGEGYVLRGLDQRLPGVPFDEETEIEIPADEAFGERDPENVQMIPYRVLRSKGVNPVVGGELEIDGRRATVRSVGAGRVQVDYNHPLAGRSVVYTLKVTENVTDDKKKMEALIGRRFLGIDPGEFKLRKTKKKVRIGVPDEVFFGENIQIAKRGVALDILRYFEELEKVEFYETIERS
jgi:peptidylprolyl isomerase